MNYFNICIFSLVATSCGLMSLGALVIETSINYLQSKQVDEHIEKKSKITYKRLDDNWIKLAEYIII